MRNALIIALIIAITGQVLYHVSQKSVASGVNPVISLLVFYLVAALLTLPLLLIYPLTDPINVELSKLNWAVFAVAGSIVLIEIGFLLAYRAGGDLSSTFVLTAAIVTTCTMLIGVAFLNEVINATKLIGVLLCLSGIALISWKTAH